MAKRKRRKPPAPRPRTALRPIAWSALLGAAIATAGAAPAFADPTTVPDTGLRPVPSGQLRLPGGGALTAPIGASERERKKAELDAATIEVAALGEQLKQLDLQRLPMRTNLAIADYQWRGAQERLRVAQAAADAAANAAFKEAAARPPANEAAEPLTEIGSGLHRLGPFGRAQEGEQARDSTQSAARELLRAQEDERAVYQLYLQATAAHQELEGRYLALETRFRQSEAALLRLRAQYADLLAEFEREQEAEDQRLGSGFVGGEVVAGSRANPKAIAAMNYALAQRGDPYLWGAEGPDRFDCSGLMWAAYQSTGATLNRVAKDQYFGTRDRTVSRYALLPGDLIFFSSSTTDWSVIYHVGMYIGGGKMVHAPTSGDVVKITTVRWGRFFAATRVYPAVAAPATTPPPTTNPPSSSPTTSPPSSSPTTSPPSSSPTTSPTTPTPTPTTPEPEPTTPAPDTDPTGSESPAPEPTAESPEPTVEPSPEESSPAGSPEPAPDPTASSSSTEPSESPATSAEASAVPTGA